MKILLWDIETAPVVAAVWGLFNQNIQHESIIQDWYMICAAWKWLDKPKIYTSSVLEGEDHTDDLPIVETLHHTLSQADAIVAHNGNAFDLKKFNARVIKHGLEPLPYIPLIDTLKIARAHFKFTSNRLDYLGDFLEVGRKVETEKGLWMKCLNGDKGAIKRMLKYNRGDITLLEDVYMKLRPFDRQHPNWNHDSSVHVCPSCGSADLQRRGVYKTRITQRQRYQCNSCGSWSSSGKMIEKVEIR